MKPRYRIRANGRPEFLTQDGFVPSVSIPAAKAVASLLSGSARLASLYERQVVIVSPKSLLPAFQRPLTTPQDHQLPGGAETHRAFPVKQNDHVSLPHGEQIAALRGPKVANVH